MNAFWIGFTALIVWAAILTGIAVWSRRDGWGRSTIMVLFVCSVPLLSITFGAALGNHRPVTWEQLRQEENVERRLLGQKIVYEEAIYIYLDRAGAPIALVLAWNTETAEQLQEALRNAGDGDVMVELPKILYEDSLNDNPPQFHAAPQPKFLLDKRQQDVPETYERNQ